METSAFCVCVHACLCLGFPKHSPLVGFLVADLGITHAQAGALMSLLAYRVFHFDPRGGFCLICMVLSGWGGCSIGHYPGRLAVGGAGRQLFPAAYRTNYCRNRRLNNLHCRAPGFISQFSAKRHGGEGHGYFQCGHAAGYDSDIKYIWPLSRPSRLEGSPFACFILHPVDAVSFFLLNTLTRRGRWQKKPRPVWVRALPTWAGPDPRCGCSE